MSTDANTYTWGDICKALKDRDDILEVCRKHANDQEQEIIDKYILFGVGARDVPVKLVEAQTKVWEALGLERAL